MLSDGQTKLDALVFDLYNLNLEEARTVLEVLDIGDILAQETLSKLTRLKLTKAKAGVARLIEGNQRGSPTGGGRGGPSPRSRR